MVLTIRSAVFPVPGALGVQEGGYVVIGNLLGIPGDAAFALSLIARVRELILGIPGLICWQMIEARRLWRARLATNARYVFITPPPQVDPAGATAWWANLYELLNSSRLRRL